MMDIGHEPPLDPPVYDPRVMHECSCCGDYIFEGDDYYELGGEPVCEQCIEEAKRTA